MTNPYYNPSGVPGTGAAGASAPVRTEFNAIAAGFAAFPTFSSGNAGQAVIVNSSGTALIVSSALTFDSSGNAALTNNLTLAGTGSTLAFSSTAQRITGDMSNPTIASRLFFQTSTAGGNSNVHAMPNGIGTGSDFSAFNSSSPNNAGNMRVGVDATSGFVDSRASGSGTVLPLDLMISSAAKMRISTAGNVLIGTTTDASTGVLQVTGNASVTGTVTASTQFSGPGTGLTGTAGSLTAGTANALTTSNSYTGVNFTATGQFNGPGTGLTGTAASLSIGGTAATATLATTASTANALNVSNAYTGTTITASTQFSGPGTGLTGTAASLNIGGNAATVTFAQNVTNTTFSVLFGTGTAAGHTPLYDGSLQYNPFSQTLFVGDLSATQVQVGSTGFTCTGTGGFTGTLTTTGGILGVTDGSNALTGNIGERLASSLVTGIAIGASSSTTIVSVTLSAGDWDIYGSFQIDPTTTSTAIQCGISPTTNALPGVGAYAAIAGGSFTSFGGAAPVLRVSVGASTTYYLVGRTTGAGVGAGQIWARRRR